MTDELREKVARLHYESVLDLLDVLQSIQVQFGTPPPEWRTLDRASRKPWLEDADRAIGICREHYEAEIAQLKARLEAAGKTIVDQAGHCACRFDADDNPISQCNWHRDELARLRRERDEARHCILSIADITSDQSRSGHLAREYLYERHIIVDESQIALRKEIDDA